MITYIIIPNPQEIFHTGISVLILQMNKEMFELGCQRPFVDEVI